MRSSGVSGLVGIEAVLGQGAIVALAVRLAFDRIFTYVPVAQCAERGRRCQWSGGGLRQLISTQRPCVDGKFLSRGTEKLYVRGVTYGTFGSDDGSAFPRRDVVERDFARMRESGINAVRTYIVPPRWVLDLALEYGLVVLVGIAWEQHVAFLEDRSIARSIEERVRHGVRTCAGHPAVLAYAIGNEIPAPIVRWHGPRRVERFLRRLYRAAKDEDPGALVTYVNYPSTEYLQLPFLDFSCFNVFLERRDQLESYIPRLQNVVGDTPLVLAELGLDSRTHSEESQAGALEWQIGATFSRGCAGCFVFAWTDEWHRGGHEIDNWDFGLTRRDRAAKPALAAVSRAFAQTPFPSPREWPRVSVVVCAHNAAATLRECLDGISALRYPAYDVLVVDDGSTDDTAAIAGAYDVRLIRTPNRGLGAARNAGLHAATGEIVAYLDADAYPDPDWLTYFGAAFLDSDHAGVGGPNLSPPTDSARARAVAYAPGGPIHVLLSDHEAEHIPGCNMAFRKACLDAIGGFDEQFRIAGDDVDICWRIQERGWTLGFTPSAVVWHHRRGTVRGYVRQQYEYGKAEALLERKWPDRYNWAGHLTWAGRVYGAPTTQSRRAKVAYGTWGMNPFQSLYERAPSVASSLPLMPEWYLLVLLLGVLSAFAAGWEKLVVAVPLLGAAVIALLAVAVSGTLRRTSSAPQASRLRPRHRALTAVFHLVQPLARLAGRVAGGLTPWRRRELAGASPPLARTLTDWSENWKPPEERLARIESELRGRHSVRRGGETDRWDLEVRGGAFAAARLRIVVEEHGAGKQFARIRSWGHGSSFGVGLVLFFAALALLAALDGAHAVAAILGAAAGALATVALYEAAAACAILRGAVSVSTSDREAPVALDEGLVMHLVDRRSSEEVASGDGVPAFEPALEHALTSAARRERLGENRE